MTEGVCAIGSLVRPSRPDRLVGRVALTAADGRVLLEIDEIEMVVLQRAGRRDGSHQPPVHTGAGNRSDLDKPTAATGAVLLVGDPRRVIRCSTLCSRGLAEHTAHCQLVPGSDEARTP